MRTPLQFLERKMDMKVPLHYMSSQHGFLNEFSLYIHAANEELPSMAAAAS
jgi:hypothetical protein